MQLRKRLADVFLRLYQSNAVCIAAWVMFVLIGTAVFSIVFWCWLRGGESGSTTIRNLGLVTAAIIGLPLVIWRSIVAERQAATAQRQSETAEHGLLNERYQKGAEMLGSVVLTVRLGGIYALQRLASEHPEQYHVQIMRLFCAFICNLTYNNNAREDQSPDSEGSPTEPRSDVHAVMDAIGARGENSLKLEEQAGYKLDLRRVELCRASLAKANLSNARLSGAHLAGAALRKANLSGAILHQADLTGATLGGARLHGAGLRRAILQSAVFWTTSPPGPLRIITYHEALQQGTVLSADLSEAKLEHSNLSSAELQGADLSGVHLTDAILRGANLSGANLSGATLVRANISGVIFSDNGEIPVTGLTQDQLDQSSADPDNPPNLAGVVDAKTGESLDWRG